MLDDEQRAAARDRAGAAALPAATVDTDGDGIADALAVRVDSAPKERSTLRAFGRWLGRSIVSIVVVASLVGGAVAVSELLHAREQRDAAQAALSSVESERDEARAQVETLQADLQDARTATSEAEQATKAAETDRDGLELENQALRRMLLDAERGDTGR